MKFDPHNIDHIKAYQTLCEEGYWPPEHDIDERHGHPFWIGTIQSRMSTAWMKSKLAENE